MLICASKNDRAGPRFRTLFDHFFWKKFNFYLVSRATAAHPGPTRQFGSNSADVILLLLNLMLLEACRQSI